MRHLADQLVRCLVTFLRTVVTVWGTVPRTRSKRDKLDCPSKLYLLPLARTVSIASLIGSYEPAMILAGSTAGLDYAPIACGESGLITNLICVDVDQSIFFIFFHFVDYDSRSWYLMTLSSPSVQMPRPSPAGRQDMYVLFSSYMANRAIYGISRLSSSIIRHGQILVTMELRDERPSPVKKGYPGEEQAHFQVVPIPSLSTFFFFLAPRMMGILFR